MPRPGLIIGLGGTGQWVLTYLKKDLLEIGRGTLPANVRLLAFDTMPQATAETERAGGEKEVKAGAVKLETGTEFVHLGGNVQTLGTKVSAGQYPHIGSWFPAEHFLRTLPSASWNLSAGAGKIRQFGRLAIFNDLEAPATSQVLTRFDAAISTLRDVVNEDHQLEICIVGSFAGGTGAGMLIDMAHLVRCVAQDNLQRNYIVRGFFVLPRAFGVRGAGQEARRMLARSFATWRELDRFMILSERYGLRRIDYHESHTPLRIELAKRAFDVCYLADAARPGPNSLDVVGPELGVFPSIADAISAILDDTAGREYTLWVTANLSNSFNSRPGEPLHSAIGTYTIKVPIYYTMQEYSHNFALDVLDILLRPIKNTTGRVVNVSAGHNLQAGIGATGREAALQFLQVSSLSHGAETLYNTQFPGLVANIFVQDSANNATQINTVAQGGLAAVSRSHSAAGVYLKSLAELGEDEDAKKIKQDIDKELRILLEDEVPPSRRYRDTPLDAVHRFDQKIPVFRRVHYGIKLADGTDTRGQYGEALERCRQFQLMRFRNLLRLWVAGTLMGSVEDAVAARGGKIGYARDFCDELVKVFDYFLTFVRKVRERREEMGIARDLQARSDKAYQTMRTNAHRKCLFFFVHPKAFKTQEAYLRAVRHEINARKDDILLSVVNEAALGMQAVAREVRDELHRWVVFLATGDAPSEVESLYNAIAASLDRVKVTHHIDQQLGHVQRLAEDRDYVRDDAAIAAALRRFIWDVRAEGDRLVLDLGLVMPGREERSQLSTRRGVHLARNMGLVLKLGEAQYSALPSQRRLGTAIMDEDKVSTGTKLADSVQGQGEPMITYGGGIGPEHRSNFIRVHSTYDPDVKAYFDQAQARLRALYTNIPSNNLRVVDSEDQHKVTFVRSDDIIRSENFAMWGTCLQAYVAEITDPVSPVDAATLHIFPAEVNAAHYEQQIEREFGENYRTFHPKVVMLLEDREWLNLFFRCLAYGFIRKEVDENDQLYYVLKLPGGGEPLYLTVPSDRLSRAGRPDIFEPDIFDVINAFVHLRGDARPGRTRARWINYDEVKKEVQAFQRSIGAERAIEKLQEQIDSKDGIVVQARQSAEELQRDVQDPAQRRLRGQEYRDLADLAVLILREIVAERRALLGRQTSEGNP